MSNGLIIIVNHISIFVLILLIKKLWLKQYADKLFLGLYFILMPIGFTLLGFSESNFGVALSVVGVLFLCFQLHRIFKQIGRE